MAHQALGREMLAGQRLGHYLIEERIGIGGMGEVYRAHDEHLDREVAIKVLPSDTLSDEPARKRFHKEAVALSRLNHPNIATIFDFDMQQGVDLLVMEYIPGLTLNNKLAKGPLPEKDVVALGTQLADGLAAAHEQGVIHRDLKPGNLRLTPDGRLKILDFGLAKLRATVTASASTESLNETTTITGTLPYMAPEQLLGEKVDARTDIHAAGLVLYEAATGKRAFPELPASELIGSIVHHAPVPPKEANPNLSGELARVLAKCLEKNPEARYQSARELAVDLRRMEPGAVAGRAYALPRLALLHGSKAVRLAGLVVFVAALGFGLLRWRLWEARLASRPARFQALAVLPLANLSGDPAREFFADGMTEELITQLGKVTRARVISRQSVMQFKGTTTSLAEIAQKLNVDAVVEGSVLQSGNRVRVTARLVDAAEEKPVWSEQYERDMRDVLSLQDEVTRAIADEIRMKISPEEQARLSKPRVVNPEAYEAYLKGRFQWYKISKQGNEDAERYFQIALQKDPNDALAYSGLADVWMMRADSGYEAPSETLPKAKAAALKALQLDGSVAAAHVSLANIEGPYDRNWAAAERDFRRAIELNPSSADAHFMYADYLISFKRTQEWQREGQQAMALDPMNFFFTCFYGWHLNYLGRYDEAVAVLQKVIATQPNFSSAHMGLWGAYYRKHMEKEALDEAIRFFEVLHDAEAVRALKTGYQAGYRAGMRRAADVLAARSRRVHVAGVRIARLYANAGERDQAIGWLERAYEAQETPLSHLAVAWDWDELRPDPRFQRLTRMMGLPQ